MEEEDDGLVLSSFCFRVKGESSVWKTREEEGDDGEDTVTGDLESDEDILFSSSPTVRRFLISERIIL